MPPIMAKDGQGHKVKYLNSWYQFLFQKRQQKILLIRCKTLFNQSVNSFYAPEIEDWQAYCFLTSLSFCYSVRNVSHSNNISTISARALIFHMSISSEKSFREYYHVFPLTFDLLLENFNFLYNFSTVSAIVFIFTWIFLLIIYVCWYCQRIFFCYILF